MPGIMPKNSPLLVELQRRWQAIFSQLRSGGEVPPSMRLRAEGLMEAVVLLKIADVAELQGSLAVVYADCFDEPLPPDWQDIFPFPQIPGFGLRAPVYPSTSD